MSARERIACLGAGRMGRGIAVVFAYAGHPVTIVDFKPRDAKAFATLAAEAMDEVRGHADEPRALRAVRRKQGRRHRRARDGGARAGRANGAVVRGA